MKLLSIILFCGALAVYWPEVDGHFKKCMDELGCFSTGGAFFDPLHRAFDILPEDRDHIGTIFRLYTQKNQQDPQYLNRTKDFQFSQTYFDAELETKMVVHGFRENEDEWMRTLKDAFLNQEAMNVITVDWGQGSGLPYTQAATNTRVVGAEIALLISRLQEQLNSSLDKYHLIGFSLGAHIMGYAGERLETIRRISALDPAGPMFEYMPPEVRLDPTDAQFVDAIHTDAKNLLELSFGTAMKVGHIDFFPNDGHSQPGCPTNSASTISTASLDLIVKGLDGADEAVSCRHTRSTKLFIDSVVNKDCTPVGYPCSDWDTFQSGLCSSCGQNGELCAVMGNNAEKYKPQVTPNEGAGFYLKTAASAPYCLFHYHVAIKMSKDSSSDRTIIPFFKNVSLISERVNLGNLNISISNGKETIAQVPLTESAEVFRSGHEYQFLITSAVDVDNISEVSLTWKSNTDFAAFFKLQWNPRKEFLLKTMKVKNMHRLNQKTSTFCRKDEIADLATATMTADTKC